ncbi:TolC family protein [Moorella sulfitireducens]|uniref:TolC family protein n=1 Tax=Neomoorella sulfitireducens TaxID=2972948 RepID=UPI0021AC4AC3|nr:TolC family protein [Moorella sulfitireducens]
MRRTPVMLLLIFIFLLAAAVPARAGDNESLELTLDDAVKKALLRSESLKISVLQLQQSEDAKDSAAYALVRFNSNWAVEYTPGVEQYYVNREQASLNYEIAKKKYAAAADGVVLAVHKAYYNVLKQEGQVKLAELAVASDEQKLNNGRLSFDLGLISRQALKGLELQLASSRAALTAARDSLDKAYIDLNLLVGLPESVRPSLVSTVEFSPYAGDLAVQQGLALEESPTVVAAVEGARLQEDLEGWSNDISDEDIEIAKLQASSVKKQVKEAVRTLYNSVKAYEENYSTVQGNVSLAEENLRVTQLKYELGMATKNEVLEAEKSLADARQKLLQLVLDHAYYKLALEKPWAM